MKIVLAALALVSSTQAFAGASEIVSCVSTLKYNYSFSNDQAAKACRSMRD